MNWETYKFRAHALPKLMVNGRKKSDPLSETTKAYLREVYIAEVYGRVKYDSTNKYTNKGIQVESDSLALYSTVTGDPIFKNVEGYENEYISGTPDVVKPNRVLDAKSSWDLWTFSAVTQDSAIKDYGAQMQGYMWLTDRPLAELFYSLTNTPDEIVAGEIYKLGFSMPGLSTDQALEDMVRRNYIFDDIAPEQRLKIFTVERDEEYIEKIKQRVIDCRYYLQTVTL